jgi:phosphonate transport system permease protein
MASSATVSTTSSRGSLAVLLSLFVPGLGQYTLRRRGRAGLILGAVLVLAFLINWAQSVAKVGQFSIGSLTTSWLWLVLAFFWLWNVYDAHLLAQGRLSSALLPVVLVAIILYVIAWNVTDVKLSRLITRFSDARLVAIDLVHPDIVARDAGGVLHLSENFQDIIGRVQPGPAPAWLVGLGIVPKTATLPSFVAGTLVQTIALGLLATLFSTVLALPLSFLAAHNIMSRVPGGTAIYYVMRTFLNIVRAVDPVIWGLIVLVWVGLGTFAGTIALTIHSVAALAKLYSEEIEHIDTGPVEAVTSTGANLLQVLRFAVVPQIVPPFLAYTLLRWDINMRAATIVGFTAGGGIGYFVVETIRLHAVPQYAAALWPVAIVIILVDYISATWRARILEESPGASAGTPNRLARRLRTGAYVVLGVALFLYCFQVTGIDLRALFEPAPTFVRLVRDFLAVDLAADTLATVSKEIIITVFQALLATTFGGLIAIPFSFLAAKNLVGRSRLLGWLYYVTRSVFNVLRSIEALLYVAIFIAWVGIGAFAGTLALAVTSFALLGKLFSEAIENIENGPMEAVTATGADRLQVIVYAILPQIFPPFASYWIYQWDINIRMATIIGFAGGGGIGLMLQTFFGSLQYHKAGTVVAFIVVVVALMDFASAKLREQLV